MSKPYYTVVAWAIEEEVWVDLYGSYDRKDCRDEIDWLNRWEYQSPTIITTDGSAEQLIAHLDTLNKSDKN
ncbi:hypothetical protein ACQU0X_08560 [Pseudovibrio ascidiaceicola]|uniref:hypothetical protein n=1 Tax=Pseudovibrio ascidiaceicola TaxID=285279 RepID=UPI003D35BD0C